MLELILVAIVSSGLTYVHLRPTDELKKICIWRLVVTLYKTIEMREADKANKPIKGKYDSKETNGEEKD